MLQAPMVMNKGNLRGAYHRFRFVALFRQSHILLGQVPAHINLARFALGVTVVVWPRSVDEILVSEAVSVIGDDMGHSSW